MINFTELFPKNLYHSYVVEGVPDRTANDLLKFLEERGEVESGRSDVLLQTYESFTIEDSGEIKSWHSRRGLGDKKRVCIIATKFINREAEQTLLKIIEEPGQNTHFFIIVPDQSVLLPTIISRAHVVKTEQESDKEIKKSAINFISDTSKQMIDTVAVIVKENKSEESSGQLRAYAILFINEIERVFYQKFKKDIKDSKTKFVLGELQKSREYLSTPGASVKMILEHLALVI